ncbi:hypothetical protein NM688_g1564 [Phlebia brevispora]|uniref:Uncharacterized protein n=1 Tax=Phlebia brevispora TaxID=194682 RepID=A0ACC1TB89_9APHY|nr:hypothetical protein NM688_g1564 [Phlebia brevispora]
MRLSLDILTIVLSHMVRRPDILSVMRTCKNLYAAGIPALLKSCILFSKKKKLSSFCDFILQDASARGRHIRDLTFFPSLGEIDDDELVEKFTQVLQHATGVEKLTFQKANKLVSNEQIATAFAQLKSVKELIVRDADSAMVDMVKEMQSPVETVLLSVQGMSDADKDPASVLAPFQRSLRKLSSWMPEFDEEDQENTYPNLHTLDVTFWNNIDMGPMIRAFPNLRNLSMYLQGFDDGGLEEDKDEIREKNEQAQEEAKWEHLEDVVADDINLYIAALKSDVDTLELRLNWQSEAEQISAILGDAHPTRLNFSYEAEGGCEDTRDHLTGCLEAASADITHFYLKLSETDDPEALSGFLEETIATLPKLAFLSLEITSGEAPEEEELARRLAKVASSLQNVAFTVSSKGGSSSIWQIERPGGNDSEFAVKELTKEECEKRGITASSTISGVFQIDC